MRKILLILIISFFSFQSFAQEPDPVYFQTWYLTYAEIDLGGEYLIVENVNPPISPYLTIYENLDFEGFGACNSFSGYFIYEDDPNFGDRFTPFDYSQTNETCEFQEHISFDNEYFYYFQYDYISFYVNHFEDTNTGIVYLDLIIAPGSLYHYQNTPVVLSLDDITLETIKLYPNPVSDKLFISSEKIVIEKIAVYSITGKKVLEVVNETNSIDVSLLSKGMYFIEISSAEGKSVKKFIKK